MLKRAINILILTFLLLFPIVATSCTPGKPSKGDIFVYVAAPLSGWQADGGQTVVGGARLAAQEINKRGGILGYRVQVVALDDEADSDVAVEVAQQVEDAISEGKNVLGVVGHYNSGQAAAALGVYKDLPIIVVTPTASDTRLTQQGYDNFFRVNATDAAQGPYDARFLVRDLEAERIVVVHANNDYGRGLKEQMVSALGDLQRPPVDVIEIQEAADTYVTILPRIKEARPDAVFLAGYETEGYVLLPEMREAGIQATFMASDGCFLYAFIDGAGQWAEGAYVSGITPDPKAVADERWWQAYQDLEARNPGTYSVAGYSALMVMAEGAKEAKTLDAASISETLKEIQFSTLIGGVDYDQHGDLTEQRIYIFQVQDGHFVQIRPEP